MRTLSFFMILFILAMFPGAIAVATQTQQAPANVCAFFSLEDARSIMGGAMKPKPNMGATVCMYELIEGYGTVALTVIQSADRAAEDRAWASIKETRHLQEGQKNTKPLVG